MVWLGSGTERFECRSIAQPLPGNLAEGSIADPPERFAGRVRTEGGCDCDELRGFSLNV